MSNEFDNCFGELYSTQTQTTGAAALLTIGSVTNVPVVYTDDSANFVFEMGGKSSTGQQQLMTKRSAWSGGLPAKGDTTTLTGLPGSNTVTQQVLSTIDRNGILYILSGDNSA